jgi:hypothetical protein
MFLAMTVVTTPISFVFLFSQEYTSYITRLISVMKSGFFDASLRKLQRAFEYHSHYMSCQWMDFMSRRFRH